MKRRIFIAAAVSISSLYQAKAQQPVIDSAKQLQTVVVTANKIPQKQSETGKVLTVISRQELERSAGRSIGEVLNQQVGISIGGANNTFGANQTVYVRGASAANTLLLMDGIPLYDASGIFSEFDLNSFAIDHIERVEILKGAQSTLYGSDAVAGVINIITRKPSEKKINLQANLSAGTYNTWRGGLTLSGTLNKFEYNIGYSKLKTDGFSSAHDSTGTKSFEKDGFNQDAFQAGLNYKGFKNLSLNIYGKYNKNKGDIDGGAFIDDRDYLYQTQNTAAGIIAKYKMGKHLLSLNYNYHHYKRKYDDDSLHIGGYSTDPFAFYNLFIKETYEGSSHFAELFANFYLNGKLNLVTGLDYRMSSTSQDYYYESTFGPYVPPAIGEDTAKTKQFSGYASLLYNNGNGFNLGIGSRVNNHSVYGGNATFSVNPSYQINRSVKVFANIASAYKVPSLYMLYSEYGNRTLEPEKSMSYEVGGQFTKSGVALRAVGFKRDIKDVFQFYFNNTTFQSIYINADEQNDHGVELEASWEINKKWNVSANYTFVDGELTTAGPSGKDSTISNLYRRPKNAFNFSLSWQPVTNLFINTSLRTVSSLYEPKFESTPVKLSGYHLLDLYAEYGFKSVKIFTGFKNITNQEYFDQQGFNARKFNMQAGVMVKLSDK